MSRVVRFTVFGVLLSFMSLSFVSCGDGTGPVPMGEASLVLTAGDAASASISPGLSAAVAPGGDVPAEAISGIELVLTRVDLHLTGAGEEEEEEEETSGEEGGQEEGGQEEGGQEEGGQEEGGQEEGGEESEGDAGAGWQTLTLSDGGTIDLVNVPESSGLVVAGGELPAGRYNNLRFFYSSAILRLGTAITVRGTEIPAGDYDLLIPSGEQTGLKVPLGAFQVEAGELETLIIEVLSNASVSSIRWNGNGFRISPVLKQREF
ncbi:MAG: DUF4382 domain-containing protein [Gemmatimonadota bacterium]|nr:MAG: DUF4382 domain-containing protein [Gemmatimonadota bacterium]